ncbi:MAG: sigma-54 dependent transcriptional regulator [Thermodesulfovibrionales bacterium]
MVYIFYMGTPIKTLHLISDDPALADELTAALPAGYTIRKTAPPEGENSIVLYDLDSHKPAGIRGIALRNFVICITQQKKTELVMEAASFGAHETLLRPLSAEGTAHILAEIQRLRAELRDRIEILPSPPVPTCAIVGHSPIIMDVCKKLARLSQVEAPVLVTGETGTGKELIAESIAQLSSRFGKPFVVVNCAAMPEPLLESELFGFEKGSFTGAASAKEGMLTIADEGTVFFDEVGELPPAIQAKLLRFLQTQAFYPIGSTREVQVNVRVISATNRDLKAMVRSGAFREDLYHRLSVTTIHIPPLRDRAEDILPLIRFFVGRYQHTAPRPIRGITRAFLKKMRAHPWPGNIRELENAVRSAIALSKTPYLTTFELKDLETRETTGDERPFPESLGSLLAPYLKQAIEKQEGALYEKVHGEVDRALLSYVLSHTRENLSEAARVLGINRLTLRKKLKF